MSDEVIPKDWEVIEKTSSGQFSADLSKGNHPKEIFLCYKKMRASEIGAVKPITGICVFLPERNETLQPDFTILKQTIGGQDVDLGLTVGEPLFIAYSRKQRTTLSFLFDHHYHHRLIYVPFFF